MFVATVVSTLVLVATIYYFCNRNQKGGRRQGGAGAPSPPSSSAKQTTMTTYTVTTAMYPTSEPAKRANLTPIKATGDASVDEGDVSSDVFTKEDQKEGADVLSYGEGGQQPNRNFAASQTEAPQEHPQDQETASDLENNLTNKEFCNRVVGLQSKARGFLQRRSLYALKRRRHHAALKIQSWWRAVRAEELEAGDVFFRNCDAILDTSFYKVYQSEESEVTWSAEETDMLLDHSDSTDAGSDVCNTTSELPSSRRSEQSDLMFGDLMTITDQVSALKFADVMATMKDAQSCVKIAEGTHSDVFRISTSEGASILKVTNLEFIVKYWDTLYAEAVISLELTKLRKKVDFHTLGFSETKRIFCLFDRYPRELIQAWKDYTSWKRTDHQHGPDDLDTAQPYMVFHSSYAGLPLTQVKVETALQLRSIVQQVAMTLAVAEDVLQFEHRDLSLSHVLVDETVYELSQYCINGRSVFVNNWGVTATVIDFAASRIKDCSSGKIIFSNLNQGHPCESRHSNVYSIYDEIGNITNGNWAGYYPRTNVACLVHLMNQLYQVYQGKFLHLGDLAESEAWTEIYNWRQALPEYRSVSDFVHSKFRFTT